MAVIRQWVAMPSPRDLPDPGTFLTQGTFLIKPVSSASPALQGDSLPMSHQRSPGLGQSKPIQHVLALRLIRVLLPSRLAHPGTL